MLTYSKRDKTAISGLECLLERYHDDVDLPDGDEVGVKMADGTWSKEGQTISAVEKAGAPLNRHTRTCNYPNINANLPHRFTLTICLLQNCKSFDGNYPSVRLALHIRSRCGCHGYTDCRMSRDRHGPLSKHAASWSHPPRGETRLLLSGTYAWRIQSLCTLRQ